MFFWQRKLIWKKRVITMRDDWGDVRKIEINLGEPDPDDDKTLAEKLETTVIIRRLE